MPTTSSAARSLPTTNHPGEELDPAVETALAHTLVADPPVAEVFHVLLAVLVAAFLFPHTMPGRLAVWAAAIGTAALWRAVCRRRLQIQQPPAAVSRRLVRMNVTLLGLAWGVGAAVIVPGLPVDDTGWILVAFSGLVAVAVVTLIADRPAFLLYAGCLLVPLAAGIAVSAATTELDRPHVAALVMIAVFAAFTSMLHGRVHRGITDRLRAQAALSCAEMARLAAEHDYRELVESASDLVCRGDAKGRWSYVNPAAERIYGLKPEQLLGRPFVERAHPDFRKRDIVAFQRVIDGEEMIDYETVHLAADGTPRYLSFSVRPRLDASGRFLGAHGIARDVTERAQAAQALREARDTAERAARTSSEFLANMSHEIRTPMNAILGMTELLLETGLSGEQRRSIDLVRISAESLLTVLNDILEFARIESAQLHLEPAAVDLPSLLESLAALFGASARAKGIELTVDIDPALPHVVRADPSRLRQVLNNLVGNAIKFTGRGRVVLAAHTAGWVDGTVEVRFAVRDTGIGIAPDQMDHIFEAFSQADTSSTRRYGGTGLGLAIARRIVRLMGGELQVSSELGAGSELSFTLRLPVDDRAPRQEPPAAIAEPRRQLRILVAEDNPFNQEVASTMLRKRGHLVDVVENGREAVDAAQREPYDMILMDIQMPEMDGFAATAAIRALPGGERIPIVACTAHALTGERERCLAAGMNGYLPKPFKARQLFTAVEEWAELQTPAQAPASAPPAAEPVDVDSFRRSLREAGAEDAAEAILATFLRDAESRAAAVAAAIAAGDPTVIARTAHAFKSAAASISARQLASLLAEIEAAGKAGKLPDAQALADRLQTESAAVLRCLRSALEGSPHA